VTGKEQMPLQECMSGEVLESGWCYTWTPLWSKKINDPLYVTYLDPVMM
jgi:hypothetical protein